MGKSSIQFLKEEGTKPVYEFINVRVPVSTLAEARKLSSTHHTTLSAFVRAAIDKMIHDLKPQKLKQESFDWK
jgi:hypothetical protein